MHNSTCNLTDGKGFSLREKAKVVWKMKHPDGRIVAVGSSNNGQKARLNYQFDPVLFASVSNKTRAMIKNQAS